MPSSAKVDLARVEKALPGGEGLLEPRLSRIVACVAWPPGLPFLVGRAVRRQACCTRLRRLP